MIHLHEDERQATLALGHVAAHRRSSTCIPEASMTASIQRLGLADLIRSNRLIIELRLTTPSELASITGNVTGVTAVKGFIRGLQAITIRGHKEGVTSHHVDGSFEMRSEITSDLVRLAPDRAIVRTQNSFLCARTAVGGRSLAQPSAHRCASIECLGPRRALRARGDARRRIPWARRR